MATAGTAAPSTAAANAASSGRHWRYVARSPRRGRRHSDGSTCGVPPVRTTWERRIPSGQRDSMEMWLPQSPEAERQGAEAGRQMRQHQGHAPPDRARSHRVLEQTRGGSFHQDEVLCILWGLFEVWARGAARVPQRRRQAEARGCWRVKIGRTYVGSHGGRAASAAGSPAPHRTILATMSARVNGHTTTGPCRSATSTTRTRRSTREHSRRWGWTGCGHSSTELQRNSEPPI